jgi:peptide deformylase
VPPGVAPRVGGVIGAALAIVGVRHSCGNSGCARRSQDFPCVRVSAKCLAAQKETRFFKLLRPILHKLPYSIKFFMALLPILRYPDPRLKTIARPVGQIDDSLRRLVSDMAETMYEAPGIGLAATQVDVHVRLVIIDTTETKDHLLVLINPEIIERDGTQLCEEGCLSLPGVYDKVERAERVRVRHLDLDGNEQTFDAEGMLAVCVQHELEHLDGHVFIDNLSFLKQTRARSRLAKFAKRARLSA